MYNFTHMVTRFFSRAISQDLSKIGHFIILIAEKQLPKFVTLSTLMLELTPQNTTSKNWCSFAGRLLLVLTD